MANVLEQLKAKVSSDMHGAEGKAIQTKRYKDLMKKIAVGGDRPPYSEGLLGLASEAVGFLT